VGLALRKLTRARGALLIVNDRVDVALAVDADGAHVGQDDMPAARARRLLGPLRLLGVSARTLAEAEAAIADEADYLGVGPIYATHGKADAGPPTGTDLLRAIVARLGSSSVPLVAIGGITAANAGEVVRAGAAGVAVITAVVNAEDVAAAAHDLAECVRAAHDTL
jgi:thiamine-phosphate pyrophosphorylase